uniref:Peptidyl-prolyl cis-trans isomerase n=2 Tax=Nannochloropsis gaditana TaxID=72520 RepID=I2CPH7_NANGC
MNSSMVYKCLQRLLLFFFLSLSHAQEHRGVTEINGTLVKCHTTAANGAAFIFEIKSEWAPFGAERFLQLVASGYFTDVPFFRVVPGFLTQFGIPPPSAVRKRWREEGSIPDDPSQNRQILRGYLSFAGAGPNTRDTQLFIALADSSWLGKSPWEVPVGRVIEGMDVIDALYAGYGEISPFNKEGVEQYKIWADEDYLRRDFPKLDYMKDCAIIPASAKKASIQEDRGRREETKRVVVGEERVPEETLNALSNARDKEPAWTEEWPYTWWGLLWVLGGLFGFLTMMWKLNNVKSLGKAR